MAALLISGTCRIVSSLAKEAQGPLFTPVSQVPNFIPPLFFLLFFFSFCLVYFVHGSSNTGEGPRWGLGQCPIISSPANKKALWLLGTPVPQAWTPRIIGSGEQHMRPSSVASSAAWPRRPRVCICVSQVWKA